MAMRLDGQEAKAREYAARRRRLWLLRLALSGALLALVALGGPAVWLRDRLEATGLPVPVVVFLYFAVGLVAYELALLPLSYQGGFVLPRRYGVSYQPLAGWVRDRLKGVALLLALGGALVVALNTLMRLDPAGWWLPAGLGLLLVTVVLANLAPVLLVPIFYRLEPIEDAALVGRLTRLAERAGARVRGVYRIRFSDRTRAANAALMGLGNTRRIVLSDTMLNAYTPDEIETVIAHELAHHVHADILIGILSQSALTLLGFWLTARVLLWAGPQLGLRGPGDPSALPLVALVMGFYGLVTTPVGNSLVRWAERRADRYALEATRKPEAFISAMERLSADNLAEREPPRWVEILLHDHPAIGRRIAFARAWAESEGLTGAHPLRRVPGG